MDLWIFNSLYYESCKTKFTFKVLALQLSDECRLHAVFLIRDSLKKSLDRILGTVSYCLIVKVGTKGTKLPCSLLLSVSY